MKSLKVPILFSACLLAIQCSTSGFDRGPLPRFNAKPVVNDSVIAGNLAKRPQLPANFKLGVYLYEGDHRDRLSHADLQEFLKIEEKLKAAGVLGSMFLVRPLKLEAGSSYEESFYGRHQGMPAPKRGEDALLDIRRQASRYGADAVLVLNPASEMREEANLLSILYLTIAGIWLVPGSERDHSYSIEASMWDVRNGYLYASAYSETRESRTRPLGWVDHSEIIAEDRRTAILELREELQKRVANLR
ncbi:MAG: hypothetical protein NXI24_07910 [bacterium]|nr:hypothetical protein [bacterium]